MGYEIDSTQEQGKHQYEVAKFEDKIKDANEIKVLPKDGFASVKIDGGSVICYYKDGKLDIALTRGDGVTGYDVTKKLSQIVPRVLKDSSFTGMVRGEIAMKNSVFNEKYRDKNSSPRNTAIGILKRNRVSIGDMRDISFVAYTVRGVSNPPIDSKHTVLTWLLSNGFECVDTFVDLKDWSDETLRKAIKSYTKYPIDGIVITSDAYKKTADGSYVPVREVAYKTPADIAKVTVTDITWNLTRTGRLFPTVWFTPVTLSGAKIQKATAFNAKYVQDNKLGVGSVITVMRSGEVIPDVQEVLTSSEQDSIPTKCPACGFSLEWDGVHVVCKNPSCSGVKENSVYHWIETLASVKGIGDSVIDSICSELSIGSVDDLYKKMDEIPSLFKGETLKKVDQMIGLLTGKIAFPSFLVACGVPSLGVSASHALAPYQDEILKGDTDDKWKGRIMDISGVSAPAKNGIIERIKDIRRYAGYVDIEKVEQKAGEAPKVIAVTGALSVPRKEFEKEVAGYGWRIASSVTKDVQFLVTDNPNSGSSKNVKAQKMGVSVVSEEDFRNNYMTK